MPLLPEPVPDPRGAPTAIAFPAATRPKQQAAAEAPPDRSTPPPSTSAAILGSSRQPDDNDDDLLTNDETGPEDVFAEEGDTIAKLEGATATTKPRRSKTTVGYLDKSRYYQFASHSFVSNINQAAEPQPHASLPPPLADGKSKSGGGNKSSRNKASETASGKTKQAQREYSGAITRHRERRRRKEEELMRRGLTKLLDTGRKLTDSDTGLDESDDDEDLLPRQQPIGDFSSADLIRNNVASPPSFDNEPQNVDANTDVMIIAHDVDTNLQSSTVDNLNSRWSFSLNPFSFLQRSEQEQNAGGEPRASDKLNAAVGSVSEEATVQPQCASTPNDA